MEDEQEKHQAAAIRERDLALAMHETFLGSGSEDALSPRFQSLDIRSPNSFSPRTPRNTTSRPFSSTSSSAVAATSPSLLKETAAASAVGLESLKPWAVDQQFSQDLSDQLAQKQFTQEPSGQIAQNRAVGSKVDEHGGKDGEVEDEELKFEACLKRLRETEFSHHERGTSRLNNGSFGACPKFVQLKQEEWVQKWLAQPDDFYFGPLAKGLLEARQAVAAYVKCPTEELVLLDNVTVAASVVALDIMWSFIQGQFQKGDSILWTNFTYKALGITFEAYTVRAGAHALIVEMPFPVNSPEEILASFERALQEAQKEGRVIRLAMIDHVVSMPSIICPVKEVVALCRRYGVEQIFVDGAQALGNVEIDLMDLIDIDADYYSGNLHKWFFAPTAVAFFHCKAKHLSRLHYPVISHNYGQGFAAECEWMGTRDFSPMLSVPAAIEFLNKIPGGYEAIRAYNQKKILAVGKMLAEAWGTSCGVAPALCGSMVMVGLPPGLGIQTSAETLALRTRLRNEFSIEVHTFTPERKQASQLPVNGVTAHLRVSHQIYNTWAEYLRLRDVINALVAEKSKEKDEGSLRAQSSILRYELYRHHHRVGHHS